MKPILRGPIVCLGDSIAAAGWPGKLEEILSERDFSVRCLNAGVRGNTSGQGLRRLQKDVLSHHPGLVFVQFGFNDCNVILNGPRPRTLRADFRTNLTAIVGLVRNAGAEAVLIGNHESQVVQRMPDGRTYEEQSRDYCIVVREVAESNHVHLVDMHDLFPGKGFAIQNALAEDHIHLSLVGVERYASIVADFITHTYRFE
jgi:lysophospholipase L1-like esterase